MLKEGLNSIIFDNEITVFWNRACSLAENEGYEVYLNGELVVKTRKTHYEFLNLVPLTEYKIKVLLERNGESLVIGEGVFVTKKTCERIDVTKAPYNAVGDGVTLNTKALQKALDDCKEGQSVYFPKGTYLTGALRLHSNMELYVDKEATIQGTDNIEDYEPMIKSRSEGLTMMCYQSLLNMGELDENPVYNCENIVIRGGGTIIGGGKSLCNKIKEYGQILLKDYIESVSDKIEEYEFGAETIAGRLRGRLVNISNCKNVVMSNIHFKDGPYWNIHFIFSDGVITKSCKITSYGIHNGDGWDPDSSKNCTCFNTEFYCGDNCIAIKSGKNPDGNRINRPTENINIFDCNIELGGGFAIGSEMSGGVRDVTMWNNNCIKSFVGMQIKTTRKRGGFVKNIRYYDSVMPNLVIKTACPYNNDGDSATTLSEVSDVLCENCYITGKVYKLVAGTGAIDGKGEQITSPIRITGFEDRPDILSNVKVKDCVVDKIAAEQGQAIMINNFEGVTIENLKVR